MAIERIPRLVEGNVIGKRYREIFLRDRHHTAFGAMNDRNRAAPIALTRDAPVAQTIIHLALCYRPIAAGFFFEAFGYFFFRFFDAHAVEEARIDHTAVFEIRHVGDYEGGRI